MLPCFGSALLCQSEVIVAGDSGLSVHLSPSTLSNGDYSLPPTRICATASFQVSHLAIYLLQIQLEKRGALTTPLTSKESLKYPFTLCIFIDLHNTASAWGFCSISASWQSRYSRLWLTENLLWTFYFWGFSFDLILCSFKFLQSLVIKRMKWTGIQYKKRKNPSFYSVICNMIRVV